MMLEQGQWLVRARFGALIESTARHLSTAPTLLLILGVLACVLAHINALGRRKDAPLCRVGFMRRAECLGRNFVAKDLLGMITERLCDQLGGLAHVETANGGFLRLPASGRCLVLKPVQSGSRGLREVAFYEYVRAQKVPGLKPFVCPYYGVVRPIRRGQAYILLSDITAGMVKPCVLDVKLGTQTYEDEAPLAKREREAAKYPPQATLGCRIVGMRIHATNDAKAVVFDKHWGSSLRNRAELERGLRLFVQQQASILLFERRIESLLEWVATVPNELVFISSSLLFVHDATNPSCCDVRLIDFAHVRRDRRVDTGLIVGLNTLLQILRAIRSSPGGTKMCTDASIATSSPSPR